MYRVFLAHSKAIDAEALVELTRDVHRVVAAKMAGAEFEIITGRDDFERRAASQALGWKVYPDAVVNAADPITGEPYFNAAVVPFIAEGWVGEVTMRILAGMHSTGRICRAFYAGQLYAIDGFKQHNQDFRRKAQMDVIGLEHLTRT